jgi:sugar phosphate isomerase/epimerase
MGAAAPLLARPVSSAAQRKHFVAAVCAYSFRDQFKDHSFSYEDLIRLAAESGAGGIDLTTYWLDTKDETLFRLKRAAYRLGVSIYTIGIRATMVQPTPDRRDAAVETVRQWLGVAEKLGAAHMRIFGGSVPKGVTEDQAVEWAVETLKRCADESGKKGVTLGIEDDSGITLDANRTVEIIRKTGSPWAGINLDIGNFRENGYTQSQICARYATNVHMKVDIHIDRQPQPADWPRMLGILSQAGYEGYLALEYESTVDPLVNVPKLISRLRDTIAAG